MNLSMRAKVRTLNGLYDGEDKCSAKINVLQRDIDLQKSERKEVRAKIAEIEITLTPIAIPAYAPIVPPDPAVPPVIPV